MNVKEILGSRLTSKTTVDELIEMLENDNSTVSMKEYNALKDKSDNFSKEASKYRKLLNENKTKEEQEEEERQRVLNDLRSSNEELAKKLAILENEKKFIALGYDEESAHKSATALAEGDMKTFFKQQEIFNQAQEKTLKAELLKNTPTPNKDGESDDVMTKEKLSTMSLREQAEFAEKNPQEYAKLYQ